MTQQKLFMVLIGCRPAGRSIEQHDIFFGIAESLRDLIPSMKAFWPEAKGKMHVDAWREVNYANGYRVSVKERNGSAASGDQLFFVNLGGYRPGDFEEYHYKMVVAGPDMATAVKTGKQTAFYKHAGFKGADSHIDDKYGIDVDDIFVVQDLLQGAGKQYELLVEPGYDGMEDELNIGYFKLDKI